LKEQLRSLKTSTFAQCLSLPNIYVPCSIEPVEGTRLLNLDGRERDFQFIDLLCVVPIHEAPEQFQLFRIE
jgi:hypothetical protein